MPSRSNAEKQFDHRAAGVPERKRKGLRKGWRLRRSRVARLARARQRAARERRKAAERERERLQQRLKTPRWVPPPDAPASPDAPAGEDYGSRFASDRPARPKRPSRAAVERDVRLKLQAALDADVRWMARQDGDSSDCRLSAAGICVGGLGKVARGRLCIRCVQDLGSGPVEGLIRRAIERHVRGQRQPTRPRVRGPMRFPERRERGQEWGKRWGALDVGELLREEF